MKFETSLWSVWKLALLAMFALPAHSALVIPPNQWGGGVGQVFADVPNYHGPAFCLLSVSVTSCSENVASNLTPGPVGDQNIGTATSMGSASVDANGAHMVLTASSSGEGNVDSKASIGFGDTLTNTTGVTEYYQLSFHLDASFFARSSASETFDLDFSPLYGDVNLASESQITGGSGTYNFINQDFTTPLEAIPANSYTFWQIGLTGEVLESSAAGLQYLAGLPSTYIDAGNTLSVVSYSVMDAGGNPLSASAFTSYAGFDINSVQSVPEPATGALLAGAALIFGIVARKRFTPSAR